MAQGCEQGGLISRHKGCFFLSRAYTSERLYAEE